MQSSSQTQTPLSSFVRVPNNFHRSVHISRDLDTEYLGNYLASPALSNIAEQVVSELNRDFGERSWTLTGPYGTGKSAFSLFLTDLLSNSQPNHLVAASLREKHLANHPPMLPILVQAERAPLIPTLTQKIQQAEYAIESDRSTTNLSSESGTSWLASRLEELAHRSPGGLLVVIDELGKYLEYLLKSEDEDIFLLQQLAEAASRSKKPIVLLTTLHAGFSDYALNSRNAKQSEWSKVQGRFRDVPFSIPRLQQLDLIAKAIEADLSTNKNYTKRLKRIFSYLGPKLNHEFKPPLTSCLPLHPLTSLTIWTLFRSKVAQNERSLFSFLTSYEPHGFVEFLNATPLESSALFGLDQLYDYIVTALGLATFTGRDASRWSLIADALERIPSDAPDLSTRIVKVIGLLTVCNDADSPEPELNVIYTAFDEFKPEKIKKSLQYLEDLSIIVFRRHKNAYALWDGSDFDLNSAYEESKGEVESVPLAVRLQRLGSPPPIAPREYYVKTGTPRFFRTAIFSDMNALSKSSSELFSNSDGAIVFLVDPASSKQDLASTARALSDYHEKPTLVAVPKDDSDIEEIAREIEILRWIEQTHPALKSDPVARRELAGRIAHNKAALDGLVGQLFGFQGHVLDPSLSTWYHCGRRLHKQPKSNRELRKKLGQICERTYPKAPILRNEMLNRGRLSGNAARARRVLIERMLGHHDELRLGIRKSPPELSMYLSMLKLGGFHTNESGNWVFMLPAVKHDPCKWVHVTKAIQSFLDHTRDGRKDLIELYELLSKPPYGVREPVMPVLVCATLLAENDSVALFEDGTFVPVPTIEMFERLIARPETFAVRSFQLNSKQQTTVEFLFQSLIGSNYTITNNSHEGRERESGRKLVLLARELTKLVEHQPSFTHHTKLISKKAQLVRGLIRYAVDPVDLILTDLPSALSIDPSTSEAISNYVDELTQYLREIVNIYSSVLQSILKDVCLSFEVSSKDELIDRIRSASLDTSLDAVSIDTRLFVNEVCRVDTTAENLAEVVGRALANGKPTTHWRDKHLEQARLAIFKVVDEFHMLEHYVARKNSDESAYIAHLDIRYNGTRSTKKVVSFDEAERNNLRKLGDRLAAILHESQLSERKKLLALSLAAEQQINGLPDSSSGHSAINTTTEAEE